MQRRFLYSIILFLLVGVIMTLAVKDSNSWKETRNISADYDGCTNGDNFFLTENIEDEGVLYIMDEKGNVRNIFVTSSIKRNSLFGGISCLKDSLYGLLVSIVAEEEMFYEYQIVKFDENGEIDAMTSPFRVQNQGILTGFVAEKNGFYLTYVMDGGTAAAAAFVDNSLLKMQENFSEEIQRENIVLQEWISADEGRLIVEARFEAGEFLIQKDDGSGVEFFEPSEELKNIYQHRIDNLSAGQYMKINQDKILFYVYLLIAVVLIWTLVFFLLQSRRHMHYTILFVEMILLLSVGISTYIVRETRVNLITEERQRVTDIYLQVLSENLDESLLTDIEGERFYSDESYYLLRNELCKFTEVYKINEIIEDICLIDENEKVLVSAGGYNGQMLTDVYGAGATGIHELLISEDGQKPVQISIGGRKYELRAVLLNTDKTPSYILVSVVNRDIKAVTDTKKYIICAMLIFIIMSIIALSILIIHEREVRKLAQALRDVAEGKSDIEKVDVYSRDVDKMWNSLSEIKKNIDRINYTKYSIFESFYRFAPKNIEKILNKDSITEVKSGDSILIKGTVAVISCEETNQKENFISDKINSFISLLEKYQKEREGFFISGNSNLSMLKLLFVEKCKTSVDFGNSFMDEFRHTKELDEFRTCILLHYAQFMYGVAGTDFQSIPFLMSEDLEGLEKCCTKLRDKGLKLVITENVKNREILNETSLRYIGYIKLSDEKEEIRLYEVLDAYSPSERRNKLETNARFAKALELFYQHDFYLARSTFSEVLKDNPKDEMAKWYLFTCEKYLNEVVLDGDICMLDL